MTVDQIYLGRTLIKPHPSIDEPDFSAPSVLCADAWDFIRLWFRRNKKQKAAFYWNQAESFYHATEVLPSTSAPLTAYYSMLNAAKALLIYKGRAFSDRHGVSGYHIPNSQAALRNETVIFHTGGIFPELSRCLGHTIPGRSNHALDALLYNVPFIHRAFKLTYPGTTEQFLPLKDPCFVRRNRSFESWFQAEISEKYYSAHFERTLPPGWERDIGITDRIILRRKARFTWNGRQRVASIGNLKSYHRYMRRVVVPIYSTKTRWYLKKNVADPRVIAGSDLALIFGIMHRLSELSRYVPDRLGSHMDSRHNWILTEFLRMAPAQFVYGIASEITGREFLRTTSYDIRNTPAA